MKLKINNIDYKVYFLDKLDNLGEFDGDGQTIKIRIEPRAKMYTTLKHELTHAYFYSFGFHQVKLNEEIFCDFLEMYGERIIADSKKLYEQFRKGEK